jgi:nucleoside-diphosphate-sugar epimerase
LIYILGGNGYFGSRLCRRLNSHGFPIKILKLPEILKYEWNQKIKKDIVNYFNKSFKNIKPDDIFVNLFWDTRNDYRTSYEMNTRSREVVLIATQIFYEANGSYSLQIGTCAEYGESNKKFVEDDFLQPLDHYGESKVQVLQELTRQYSLNNFGWMRPFFVYGEVHTRKNIVQQLVDAAIRGKHIFLHNPERVIDLVHIRDVIVALEFIGTRRITGIYNISSGKCVGLGQLQNFCGLLRHSERPSDIDIKCRDMLPTDAGVCGDNSKMRSLGWLPSVSLASGLQEMIASGNEDRNG